MRAELAYHRVGAGRARAQQSVLEGGSAVAEASDQCLWDANVQKWLDGAPQEVADETRRLLSRVAAMRETQVIYPAQENILRALSLTVPADVRVVILGQDPYHEPGQAQGLSFSVPAGCKLPPSLRNIYKELASDLSCPMPKSGDLTSWATQGVLLMNTTLTVVEHAANSHAKLGWQTLTSFIVRRVFEAPQPVVFLAWGRHAISLVEAARNQVMADQEREAGLFKPERDSSLDNKFILSSTHPSPLSASRSSGGLPSFLGSRPFTRANELLEAAGSDPVKWTSVCD